MKKIDERKIKRDRYLTKEKTVALMATLGFIVNSLTSSGAIIKVDKNNGTIETNGNVTNIWADKVNGNNALNHFEEFKQDANQIANMHFKEKNGSNEADRLFNFVNSRIEVNGTVNAIKNNKIGGELYFLSTDGMIVGNTGTINTGSLYIMTPTKQGFNDALNALKDKNDASMIIPNNNTVSIPLNPKGTITVRGQINAIDHIEMHAAKIEVGNVGTLTKEEGTYQEKVNLKTGVTDFSNLVNINGINSGLKGEQLKAIKTGDGNIVLRATSNGDSNFIDNITYGLDSFDKLLSMAKKIEEVTGVSGYVDKIKMVIEEGKSLTEGIDYLRPVLSKAEITLDGAKIEAAGNFGAKAHAINRNGEIGGNAIAQVEATVNIKNSKITAEKDVNINAISETVYIPQEEETTGEEGSESKLTQKIGDLEASLAIQSSSANVNIEGSELVGENLNISSENSAKIEVGAELTLDNAAGGGKKKKKKLAAAGVIIYADGESKVDINGSTLTSTKVSEGDKTNGINISSKSSSDILLNAGAQSAGETFTAALGIVVGANKSTINMSGSTLNSAGTVNIESKTENSLESNVLVNAEGAAAKKSSTSKRQGKLGLGTAVNIVKRDSSSNVNIEKTDITSKEKTDITSENRILKHTIVADNTMGVDGSKFSKKTAKAEEKFDAFVEKIKGMFPEEEQQVKLSNATPTATGGTGTVKGKIQAGAAIGVINGKNSSGITIKNSNIKADGDLNISSNVTVDDIKVSIVGDTYSGKTKKNIGTGTGGTDEKAVSLAVLYSNIENDSSITIEDDTDGEKSSLIGANVNITSKTEMSYNRINNMIADLEEANNALIEALKTQETLGNYKDKIEEKIQEITDYIGKLEEFKQKLTGEDGGFIGGDNSFLSENSINTMKELAIEGKDLASGLVDLIKDIKDNAAPGVRDEIVEDLTNFKAMFESATEFLDGGNYANFYVRTATNDNKDLNKGLRAAGSVAINNFSNSNNINIGNVKIEAKDNLNIEVTNENDSVSIVGNMQDLTLGVLESTGEKAKTEAIGASFGMQNLKNIANITIKEGTELIGENINIASNNDVFNVAASVSSGHSGKDALNGMVSYVKGSSKGEISVDDDVNINAKNIDISTLNSTTLMNIAGAIAQGGNIAVGASAAVNEYDVTTKANIGNNGNDTDSDRGTIVTDTLDVNATTDGMITAVSVAGGVNSGEGKPGGVGGSGLGSGGTTGSAITNAANKVQNAANALTNQQVQNGMATGSTAAQKGGTKAGAAGNGNAGVNVDIAGAGSVAINLNDNETTAGIDGVKIVLKSNDNKGSGINVEAKDESFVGALSGAAAINWSSNKSTTGGSGGSTATSKPSVAAEGAIGLNILNNHTNAVVKNVEISNFKDIQVNAINDSVIVSSGLGLAVSNNGQNYSGGASVSLNLLDTSATALLENATVNGKDTDIDVSAVESGIQVTGGANIEAGKGKGAVGGGVAVAITNNKVNAGIVGGTYKGINDINVDSSLNMKLVTATAAIGVVTGGAQGGIGSYQGAVVYNELNNTVSAGMSGATIEANGDIRVTADDILENKTTNKKVENKYDSFLKDHGIDTDGKDYYGNLDVSAADKDYTEENSTSKNSSKEEEKLENNKSGSTIVTGAAVISGSKDGGAAGAGIVYDKITNKYEANISDVTITKADSVSAETSADTFLLGVAGGAAGSTQGKFGGMGSVSWQEVANELNSSISNSTITANNVNSIANNIIYEINVGGQVSYGKTAAVGAVLANSDVKNITKANISGGTITAPNIGIKANSDSEIITIGAGVSASKDAAIAGTVAINRVDNITEATLGNSELADVITNLNKVENIDVNAIDTNSLKNVVAGVTVAGTAAVGGSVAYSEINSDVNAGIFNTTISTSDTTAEKNIKSEAKDDSEIVTVAIAAGGSTNAAVQGAAATSIINKDVSSQGKNLNIDNTNTAKDKKSELNIIAENNGSIVSNASVISVGGTAGAGAGVAVNQIKQNTDATLNGGEQNLENALIKAKSLANITTIGIGGGIGGTAGVAGSIAVNLINNNTKTTMSNNTLNANGSVGVIAKSDDIIANYAGTLAGGGTAAIGTSVSVNQISGDTLVTLNNANVTANGKGNGIEVDSKIENGSIIDSVIDGDKTLIGNDLDKDRKEETIKGIVVDSSATHTLKSVLANGGVAGTAAVNGTVNVNEIGGNTGASVTGSNLNSAENLSVRAKDYTNSSGLVTTVAIAGTGAGVGASSDTNIVDRDANVTIGNSNLTGNKVDIDAVSKQGISSFGIGVAGAGIGGAVAGTVTVVDLKGDTSVIIKDNSKIKANNENVDINADHYGTINAGTGTVAIGAVGAGVGAAVSVIKDQNHTIVDIAKTDITANKNVNIGANNVSKVTPTVTAVAGAGLGAGVAGTVAINNIANVVATNISDSNIKSNSGNIDINAKNRFENNLVGVGVAGGGFAGVGAVVNVNTVDSAVAANISGTTITADNGNIKVNAEEERDIEQVVSNTAVGGAAVGANVLVNNFGKAENLDIDLDDYYEQANTATGQNKYDDIVGGILGENGVSTDNEVTADKGGSNPDSNYETGIKVNIDNGSKLAGNNVNVNAKETNKITSTSVGTAAGGVSASGTVAITNINRNVGINIANSDIKTKDKINIEANTTGDVNLDVWQGSAGVASIGAAYGAINSFGKSLVNLSGTNLTSGSIDVANKDNLAISSKASGLTGGVIAAGAIVSQAENKGSVAINLEGSTLTSTDDKNGKINIKAEKANNVKPEAIGGSVGVISGNAVTATAKDNGRSEINIGRLKGTLSSIIGKDIDINAINKMGVQAKSGSAATGYLGTAGVSVTLAETNGKALIKAEDGAILEGDKIDVNAEIGTLDNKEYTVSAETDSASTALEGATDANIAHVINNSSAEVKLKNMKIGSAEEINITSKNNTKLKADIDSLSFGGVFAAGANEAQMENNGKAIVEFSNNGELTEVEKLNIEGTSSSENTLISNGNGGGGLAGLGAAIIKNNINTKADVVFGGNWKVADILDIKASDNNKVSLSADSTRGGLVGANGINIENNVSNKEATKVKIVDGTKVSGTGSVNVESRNDIDVDINASGAAYGAVGNANVIVKNNVDKKTEIEIGKADIVTDGKQEYQGFTNADILVKNKIDAIGAVAITIGKTENTLNTSNKISLAENGNLKTNKYNQDIILAASDKIKDIVEGIAESSGAGAGSRAEVTSNFDRKNRIDVNGNILSYNDAKLYAGMDKNGVSSSVDYRALAHSYTHGVFTGATPILNTNISMGNQVATGVNSKVESVRNINIEANSGESRIEKAVQKYTWYDQENSSDYVTSANGEKNENIDSVDNYADIQGKLHAGIYAKQDITIDGVVDLNKDKNGKTDIVDADVTSKPIITLGDGTKVDITTGIEDYANSLIKRYNEICELLKNYSDEKSAAYQGYQAEKTRILNTMLSLGLAEERTFKDGNTAIVPTGKLDIQYIKLSDLVASGGNITINSENIKNVTEGIDSGRVVAEGSPKVSITNNSNLYLKVGDIRILEKGGKISINNKVIKDVQSQDKPAINISNNWDSTLKVLDKNGKKQDVKVLSTIEITGNIENLIGDISIVNKGGDILMQGEKVGDSTNVLAGGNLNLSAKGSISQAYTAGITNIGTAPEQAWKDTMEQTKSEALDGNNLQGNQNEDFNKETGIKGDSTSSGMAAGGEIYLNGEVININGKVQSGFDKYEVVINGNDKGYNNQKIDNLINSYNKEWEKNKTVINTNNLKDYILTEGKTEYDSKTGTFYYKPATYYDPSTKQVVVENIDVGGGKVYVTGRVISTGNGKITALDGAANIKIDNNTSTALKVGSINNKDVAGIISINDTQKNTITEYYRDKTITKTLTDKKDSNGNYIYNVKEETIDGKTRYYTPDEGMRYNWTEGSTTGTETTYTQSNDFYLWGGIRLSMDQVISQGKGTPQETVQLDKNGKPVGSFISQDKNNTNDFTMNFTNKVEEKGEIVGKREWTDYHDFLHFSGTDYYEWTEKKGTEQSYTGSIKADRDIAIGFIGSENGNIDISSKNNIELAGSITNARGEKGTSVTTITSENGNITGTVGTITADTINLNGKTGIENITISGIGDTVNLNAIAKNGNVDITTKGNLSINEVIGKDKVNLSAYGNISQQNKNKTGVTGSRIDLVSENGGIDLVINSGDSVLSAGDTLSASVNASAKNNITLKESEGDMRIGKIYSSQGDVTLETDGYIVDALPTGEIKDNSSTEEKINRWEEAGLIASEELTAKKEAQYKEYTDGVKAEYDEYLALKGKNPETGSVEANRLETLEKKYNQYGSADDYITNSDEGKYQLKVKNSGGKWNKDQLLYAIQESIINQDSGSTQKEVKDPNIKGVNITIKAGAGVGVDKGETTIDLNNLGTEELKKLASSEAADVIWNNKGDKPTAIIREKNPIGIQMIDKEGKLNVNAKDNIYLAARTDVSNGSSKVNTIYVDNISSKDGNIRLLGTGGVFNVSQSGPNFTGNNLILEGGTGDLGAIDKALTMNLNGTLTARSDGSIYLNQKTGDMNVAAIYAGKNVNLISAGNIFSTNVNVGDNAGSMSGTDEEGDENLVLGYINAGEGITLNASGDIGKENQGVNILNGKTHAVNATGNNIYLQGKKDGTLLLGAINSSTGKLVVNSEDSIKTSESIDGKDITFNAKNSIILGNAEKDTTITSDNLTLTANNGNINQLENNNIVSDIVTANANTGINLGSETNKFNLINLGNKTGDILVNNSGANGLGVTFDRTENAGNITINNSTGNLVINNSATTTGENDIVLNNGTGDITVVKDANLTAGKDITMTTTGNIATNNSTLVATNKVGLSAAENIETAGNISGNDVEMTSTTGSINTNSSEIKAINNVTLEAAKDITNKNIITAGKDILVSNVNGDLLLNKLEGGNIALNTTNGNITLTGNSTANAGDIKVTLGTATKDGITVNGNLVASNNVDISSTTGNVSITGDITAKNDVLAKVETGDITVKGDTEATTGNVTMGATTGDVTLSGNTTAKAGDIKVTLGTATKGGITVNGNLVANKDINISTNKGNIGVTGSLTSGENTTVTTTEGTITLDKGENEYLVQSGKDVSISTGTGAIATTGNITGTNNVALNTTDGDITVKGDTEATNGNVTIGTAEKGNINVIGDLTSGIDTTIATNKVGNITLDGDITSSEDTLVSTKEGNITLVAGTDINATKDITLSTETGSITGSKSNLISGNNLIAKAINGVIKLAGLMKADKDISVNTTTGSIDLAGERVANNVTIGAATGDVTLTGNTTAKAGDVKVTLGTAKDKGITVNGNLVANNNVDISSTTGNVTITGDITAENDVLAKAETGNITITGDTTGNNDVAINTVDGNITVEGKVTATNGNTTVVAKENGNIQLTGDITTAKNTTISTEKLGNINLTGNINTKGDTLFSTNSGNIVVNKDRKDLNVNTGNNFTAKTIDGDIILDGNINSTGVGRVETSTEGNININNFVAQNDLYVTTATGDIVGDNLESTNGSVNISSTEKGKVTIDDIKAGTTADIVTKDGDIDITNLLANKKVNISTENGNITSTGSLSSINDSMKVYSAKGDIKINDSYAKGENRVTAKDGNIYIKKLNGDFVIVTLGNKDKEMKVEETIVGKGAIVSGNDITVDNLGQREGETVPVEITFNNSEDNKNAPISNIELHAKGIKNGVKVNRLWVHDANITTDSNILQFPELVVTGKGFFANDSTTVSVYGEDSLFDGSNIHIWNDADKKEWITLNFLPQGNTVYTDGRLLKLQDGYNVYYQRITAKDYMIDHLDYLSMEHKLNEIRDPFNYLYNPYLQYNLIDNNIKIDNSLEVVATEDDKIIIKEDGEVAEITIDPSMKVLEKDKDLITATLGENSK